MAKDLSGAQTGISPRAGVNDPRPNNIRGRNTFPQTFMHLTTDRYGEYSPFYWCKAERGDVQNLKTDHDIHTFTMKSPFVGNVEMTKSFIKVPMQAIYPINWEKMMTIPTQGDDVPTDCRSLLDVVSLVKNLFQANDSEFSELSDVNLFIKRMILLELICSHGSLFERFNFHFNFKINDTSPDVFFGNFWETLLDYMDDNDLGLQLNDNPDTEHFLSGNHQNIVSRRRMVELFRRNDWTIDGWSISLSGFGDDFIDFTRAALSSGYYSYTNTAPIHDSYINIEPIIAYQLSCAQFGSNDFVDYIYSADLYRQNMFALARYVTGSVLTFSYNGIITLYDVFSEKYLTKLLGSVNSFYSLDFFINLFSYVPSLRFGDYFTGAKPRPLAVGEYSANVVDNSVSAVDVTRSIQMQRLLNQVNMVGRKLGDYLAGIFGGQLPEAPKDVPVFLAHQSFTIGGFETENTGERQFAEGAENANTITSHLRSSENRHSFDIEIAEPCYIIGMNSYSMRRIYSRGIDRFAFHHDRYDDFLPQMQYIGDQDIQRVELDSSINAPLQPYAYTLRYMEYKLRISYASGGFIENLPSWAFITDNKDGNPSDSFINSDYIRSSPSEFDRFYKSLSGYSLGQYFHFIVAHTNITEPVRQMDYAPEILK